jgi:hypothetical protein
VFWGLSAITSMRNNAEQEIMASPLRLAHPLKRKDNTERLASDCELPTASRLYSFISKDNGKFGYPSYNS